jgi:hypothetical protein
VDRVKGREGDELWRALTSGHFLSSTGDNIGMDISQGKSSIYGPCTELTRYRCDYD